jgi:beta-xylosidase
VPGTRCNPIIATGLADPFVLAAGGSYCLYGSHGAPDGRFLPVYRSADLASWEFVRGAVAPGGPGAWNRVNFWAPEVLERDGRFWIYYTAAGEPRPDNSGNRVGLAVADSPEGPFEDRGVLVESPSLDGSPFVDADGEAYLYYTAENGAAGGSVPGRIYVDRLPAPERVEGRPRGVLALHSWQEGACALRRGGRCYLFYSVGNWRDESYHVRWAVGDSPLGPFEEAPGRLLESTPEVRGPGHHNFFRAADGSQWIVYHGWDPAFTARYPRIDRLGWDGVRPVMVGRSTF